MPKKFTLANQFTKPELELGILASLARNPELYWEVMDMLPKESFVEHQKLFEELAIAIEQEHPLPNVAGEPTRDVPEAAKELSELYQKRLLAELAQNFLEHLRGEDSADSLIVQIEDGLVQVQQAIKELKVGQVVTLPDLLPEVLRNITARREAVVANGNTTVGLPTGIPKLDNLLGGLQAGLHLLAAEPGQGKTTLTLQIATNVVKAGYPVLFVSFEESLERLALKAICQVSGLEMKKFADGYAETSKLQEAMQEWGPRLKHLHLLEGTGKLLMPHLKAKALQIMSKSKVGNCLVIVDYLQRWASGKKEFCDFRHVVSGIVSELRELALRLDSPILVISSQNRPGQGSAHLTSLKESGDLEYSADSAMFLVDSNGKRSTRSSSLRAVDLVVEKNRYGGKGVVELIFKPEIGVFLEVEKDASEVWR